jgi:transcription antitermination factor NusG
VAFWACAQLVPQRERLALHTLTLAGYVTYLPRLRARRLTQGRAITTTPPLFPGYAFVLIELQWHAARWSPGVRRIVMDGMAPARVPDKVIAEIRSRERGGLVELPSRLKRGGPVRVLRGPFREHLGLYQNQNGHERVAVLLAFLGGQHRVTLPRGDVEAV